jgi:hypothetical protein
MPKTEDTERTEVETNDEEEDKEIRERLQCNFIHSLGKTTLRVPVNLNYYTYLYDKYVQYKLFILCFQRKRPSLKVQFNVL